MEVKMKNTKKRTHSYFKLLVQFGDISLGEHREGAVRPG